MSNPGSPSASAVALATIDSPSGQVTLSPTFPGETTNPVVDDVRWAPANGGTLYVVDQGAGVLYKITGPLRAGQALASQPTDPSIPPLQGDVVNVDLGDGTESPFATGFSSPKGLLFVTRADERSQGGDQGQPGRECETRMGGASLGAAHRGSPHPAPRGPSGAPERHLKKWVFGWGRISPSRITSTFSL